MKRWEHEIWVQSSNRDSRIFLPARDRPTYLGSMQKPTTGQKPTTLKPPTGQKPTTVKPTIGWREWVQLPELEITRVKAKVDTGARSSSLHAFNVVMVKRRKRTLVRFTVHPMQYDPETMVECTAELVDQRWVKSSNGERELRPTIRTLVSFGGEPWPIDLTLTSRDLMGFRMLLGREAVRRRFLIDPGRSFLMKALKP
jgi:hypothetical protein